MFSGVKSSTARALVLGTATLLILLCLWQAGAYFGLLNSLFFSSPLEAGVALLRMLRDGQLWTDTAASAMRAVCGFLGGSALAILVGLATGRFVFLSDSFGQVLRMLRGIPAIAIIPFVLIWFGLGEGSKIAVITWAVFFPVWLNVHLGVRGVPVKYVWIAESLGANGRGILVSVILPAALPAIIAGMRTGIGIAYVALFGAEMTGALAGIGYRIYSSYTVYRVDVMVADLIALGVLAALTDALFAWFARSVFPWIAVQSGAGHALANRK